MSNTRFHFIHRGVASTTPSSMRMPMGSPLLKLSMASKGTQGRQGRLTNVRRPLSDGAP